MHEERLCSNKALLPNKENWPLAVGEGDRVGGMAQGHTSYV